MTLIFLTDIVAHHKPKASHQLITLKLLLLDIFRKWVIHHILQLSMIRYKMRLTPFPLLELAGVSPCSFLQRLYVEVYRCFTDHLRK